MGRKNDWVEKVERRREVNPDSMRAKDVAHLLDCSPDDVLDWRRKGLLKGRRSKKTPRFWYFRLDEVKKAKKGIQKYKEEYI